MTVTQSTKTNPIITSVMWPTAKTTRVPLPIYNVPSARIQGTPNCPRPQPRQSLKEEKGPQSQSTKFPQWNNQPANLIPKATATATPAILPVMSIPPRGPTPWPNTVPTSANLFITRSWPLPTNNGDSLKPTMQKMIKSDPSHTENTPRETTIPHPVSLITENYTAASSPATTNIVGTSKSQEEIWGPSCQWCAQSTSHPEQNWSKDDWDGEIQKAKQKEMQRREEELKQELTAEEHGASATYYPPSPQYKAAYEEDPPIMRDLPPEPTQEGHLDHNRIEE